MKRVLSAAVFAMLLLATLCAAAQNPPAMPKPGPEQKNLGYFAGNWKTTGDLKAGPMGPGGKFTGNEHIEWMPGGFFLVSHTQVSGSSNGEVIHATGAFDGKVWTWSSEMAMGGKTMKSHFILTEASPTSYTYKFEISEDGNNWAPVMDGGGTKVASAGAAMKKKK